MYKKIMVPLDGYAAAEDALATAVRIARKAKAQLHLVHVLDLAAPPPFAGGVPTEEWWTGSARQLAETYLGRLIAEILAKGELTISHAVCDGLIAPALLTQASECGADFIVMATHGRGPVKRLWLGSVAGRIARESEIPILLLRWDEASWEHAPTRPYGRILVPLDGSPLAETIVPMAQELALVDRAQLVFLHVGRPEAASIRALPMAYANDRYPESVVTDLTSTPYAYLNELAARPGANVPLPITDVRISSKQPELEILDYAATHQIDAIALTSHGHSGLRRMLLGNVADQVVRAATVPVLIYRPKDEPVRDDLVGWAGERVQQGGTEASQRGPRSGSAARPWRR